MTNWMPFGEKSLDFIYRPIEDDYRINILEGSVRSSKTFTMIPKWLRYIAEGPPGLLVMTGVSKNTVFDNVLRDLFDTVGSSNYTYNRMTGDLEIFGRQIKVFGARDEGSEKYLRGLTVAGAYCDEGTLMPEKFFMQLLNRMSVTGAKLYMTTNPDTPAHYLYKKYIINPERADIVRNIHFVLDDNPNLDAEYKDFIRNAHSGLHYKRFILGQWVMGEGSIFDMWDDPNVYKECPVVQGVWDAASRDIAIDYGTTNPMVFLDIYDTGDLILIDREYYHDSRTAGYQKTDAQYVADLDAFCGGPDEVRQVIIDPSAASFRVALRQRGYRVKDADNEVADGIRVMANMIARRIIRVNERCHNFIQEVGSYVWNDKKTKLGKEEPVKANDHAMDACRYWCFTIYKPRRLAA